jgi:dephospho-CoA kinase
MPIPALRDYLAIRSRGFKRNGGQIRPRLSIFYTISDHPQGKCLNPQLRLFRSLPVGQNPGKFHNLRKPTPINLFLDLHQEFHDIFSFHLVTIIHIFITASNWEVPGRYRLQGGTIPGMRVFGLTGNIGSGKSTVAAMLRDAGIPVLDADRISKEVTAPGGRAYDAVVQAFGKGIVRDDGSIDRKRLGEIVFSDPASRERLERIAHPAILEAMKEEIAGIERKGHRAAVVEATLIHETGRKGLFDAVISVTCDRETAISRLAARDGMSRGQAEARLRAQMDADQKAEASDYVIDNSSSTEETSRQVNRIARILLGNE